MTTQTTNDPYKVEAERIFSELEPLINKDPDSATRVAAQMALAGSMNMGVSLNLMLMICKKQMAMEATNA